MSKTNIWLVVSGLVLLFVTILTFAMFDLVAVKGNEIGVMESWSGGVLPDPLPPKTYFCLPWQRIQTYPTSVQVFVMKDKSHEETAVGRQQDSYLVQSMDSQDMYLSFQVQWRIDPAQVITIHKTVGPTGIEEKILRPTLLRVVKDEATIQEAIDAYSGTGLVTLQQHIEKKLNNPEGEIRQRGLIVDSFVIEHIRLDAEYVGEIKARQVAMMKEQRAVQEEKAAQAEALKAKALAQADLNKAVVEAERDKQVAVLKAEADNEKVILQAQAENEKVILQAEAKKKETVLDAEGEKESGELRAQAIKAIGQATAEAEKLKFSAYSAEGSETYARIEVAKSMAQSLSGIKGYLPEHMSVVTLGENFLKSVENVVGSQKK